MMINAKTKNEKIKLIYNFIKLYINKNKISPSFYEISKGCKIKSTETIRRYLLILEELGYIKLKKVQTTNLVTRGIEIVNREV